jgi:hypothetical protein
MTRSVASIGKEILSPDPGLGACLYSIGYGKVNCKEFHASEERNKNINSSGTNCQLPSKHDLRKLWMRFDACINRISNVFTRPIGTDLLFGLNTIK